MKEFYPPYKKGYPMEIRKLKPEENIQRVLTNSICFVHTTPPADRLSWLEKPEEHTYGYENAWGAFDETGRLLSSMLVIPAQIMINNQPTKAGLIGGVTTLPEARNSRCVRKIFDKIMPLMKEEGVVYSLLYPFSFHFYRKFGYEHAYIRPRAIFPTSQLSRYPYPDEIKVHDKGGPWADFAKVYEAFAKDKNLAVVRGEKEWQSILDRDPHKNRDFTYIHYNKASEPTSYILYKYEPKEDGGCRMNIRELAWVDKHGLEAMLGFVHGLRSEYAEVSWPIPEGLDVLGVVEDPWDVKITQDTIIMNRIVNVPAALSLTKAPPGKGSAAIQVTDAYIESNTGVYNISWENGNLSVEKTSIKPDMETDVETLVQLTTGYLTPAQALYRKNNVIHSKPEELAALFPRQNLYLMEGF